MATACCLQDGYVNKVAVSLGGRSVVRSNVPSIADG